MAGSATNFLENILLNHALGNAANTFSASRWLALYTVAPTDTATGTESTGGSYARKPVTFTSSSVGSSANILDVDFTNMPASTVVAVAVTDAVTTGNILFYSTLVTSRILAAGDTLRVPAGGLTVSLD